MEDLCSYPILKQKRTNLEIPTKPKFDFTSPRLEEYQELTLKYKNYLNNIGNKIDLICQKQRQRNVFKERKLNTVKTVMMKKKSELQEELTQKLDPIKSENGRIHSEIATLKKLEFAYAQILQNLEKNAKQKDEENRRLKGIVKEQKRNLKGRIKQSFINNNSQRSSSDPKVSIHSHIDSVMSQQSRVSMNSRRSKQKFLSRLSLSWQDKIQEQINLQGQKLMMLKLLIVYAQSDHSEGCNLNEKVLSQIRYQVKQKSRWLQDIKELMMKQGTQSLGDN